MAQDGTEVVVEKLETAWVLGLRGEHDLSTHDSVAARIDAIPPGSNLLIDLSATSFLDSTIVGVLYLASRRFQHAGGRVAVVAPPGSAIGHTIDLIALGAVIPVHGDRNSALAAFG